MLTTLSAGFSGCKSAGLAALRGLWCRGPLAGQAEMEGLAQREGPIREWGWSG